LNTDYRLVVTLGITEEWWDRVEGDEIQKEKEKIGFRKKHVR
jgi:hypothetical protein